MIGDIALRDPGMRDRVMITCVDNFRWEGNMYIQLKCQVCLRWHRVYISEVDLVEQPDINVLMDAAERLLLEKLYDEGHDLDDERHGQLTGKRLPNGTDAPDPVRVRATVGKLEALPPVGHGEAQEG